MKLSKTVMILGVIVIVACVIVGAMSYTNDETRDRGPTYSVADFSDTYKVVTKDVDGVAVAYLETIPGLGSILNEVNALTSDDLITIELENDLYLYNSDNIIIADGKNVLFDGNGYTIYRGLGNTQYMFEVYGTLEMIDVTIDDRDILTVENNILVSTGTLSIRDSNIINANTTTQRGGAIQAIGSVLNIYNSTFDNNFAHKLGGALDARNSTVTITNSSFTDNQSMTNGGAISLSNCTATLTNVTFDNNSASSNGGAIVVGENTPSTTLPSTVNAYSCTYTNNTAYNGGAIRVNCGTYTMYGGTVSENTADSNGGGVMVACYSSVVVQSKFILESGSILNNLANTITDDGGGGIYVYNYAGSAKTKSVAEINGGTIQGNKSYEGGGAIAVNNGTLTINGNNGVQVLFEQNTALEGGAIYISKGNVSIAGADFQSNTCTNGNGGAIYVVGISTFIIDKNSTRSSTFRSNSSSANYADSDTGGGNGGAIAIKDSAASIYGGIFEGNTANNTGALSKNNRGNGGAISIDRGAMLFVYGGSFTDNTANNGGAFRVDKGSTLLFVKDSNIIVSDNIAKRNGGAFAISGGQVFIYSGTITNNSALGTIATGNYNTGLGGAMHIFLNTNATETAVEIYGATISGNTSDPSRGNIECSIDTQISIMGTGPQVFIGDATITGSICLSEKAYVSMISDCPGTVTISNEQYSSIAFENLEPKKFYGAIKGAAIVKCNNKGLTITGSVTLYGVDVNGLTYTYKNETNNPSISNGSMDVSVIVSYTPVAYDITVTVTAIDADGTTYRPSGATVTLAGGSPATEQGTGNDIVYILSDVPFGITADLTVSLEGYMTSTTEYTFNNHLITTTSASIHENTIYGTVTFNRNPIEGATVIADADGYHEETTTDSNGSYSFVRMPNTDTTVEASYGEYIGETITVAMTTYDNDVDLQLFLNIAIVTDVTIVGEQTYTYTSQTIEPNVTVTLNESIIGVPSILIEDVDYTISYGENIHVDDGGTIYVNGIGIFAGQATKTFTITPKEVDAVWGSTEFIYSGVSQMPTAYANGIGDDGLVDISVNCDDNSIDVGSYTAYIVSLNDDYSISAATSSVSFEILPFEAEVIWGSLDLEYNHGYLVPSAYAYGIVVDGNPVLLDLTITTDPTEPIDAGIYTATASLVSSNQYLRYLDSGEITSSNPNYVLVNNVKTFEIHQKELTVTWEDTDLIYDSTSQFPGYTVSGVIDGDDAGITETGEMIDAGNGYVATISLTNDNYVISGSTTTTFDIQPRTVSVSWNSTAFIYNAEVQIPTATPVNVCDGDTVDLTVTSDGLSIDVGTYTATAVFSSVYSNYVLDTETDSVVYEILTTLISGVVTNGAGDPIADVQVIATYQDVTVLTYTDANGDYLFGDIPSGNDVTISASMPGMYSSTVSITDFDGSATADITLDINIISGMIIDPKNKGMADVEVTLTDGSGLRTTFTDENGLFEFTEVIAGPIIIDVVLYGYDYTPYSVDFQGGEITNLKIELTYHVYTVTAVTDRHSRSNMDTQAVSYLHDANLEFYANSGYRFVYYTVDDGSPTYISGTTFVFKECIVTDITVSVYTTLIEPIPGPTPETFTVTVTSMSGGHVTGAGDYENGATATLVAIADEGYVFDGWSNGMTGTTISFTVTEDVDLVAYFQVESVIGGDVNPEDADSYWTYYVIGICAAIILILLIYYRRSDKDEED